jgi:hypothetical protein
MKDSSEDEAEGDNATGSDNLLQKPPASLEENKTSEHDDNIM